MWLDGVNCVGLIQFLLQVEFVQLLLDQMYHSQHSKINSYLKPKLKRDFLLLLPNMGLPHVAVAILEKLDHVDLAACEAVSKTWRKVVSEGMLWKKLIQKNVKNSRMWQGLGERRGWLQFINSNAQNLNHDYYRSLYPEITRDINRVETNWRLGEL